MKIRIVPVAAGLAAAAGIAITGASLANAATTTSIAATAYTAPQQNGEVPSGQPPRGNGNTDPSKPMRSDETLLTGDFASPIAIERGEDGAVIGAADPWYFPATAGAASRSH